LGIAKDITDRKKIQTELDNRTKELARSNTELEQFAYIASHDLQEPLRMVTSYLQLLEKRYSDKLDKDAKEFISYAVDGSNRMRSLIHSLLDYSRINRVKPFEIIDVNLLLKEVLENLSTSIKENNATIKIGDLPKINGDPILINQLFQNLIQNAVKFRNTRNPEIDISCKEEKDEYLFSVKDNGIGIQKEYIDKIFVIFKRLHSKEEYPGTGMGLAICKKIVERHGGKIWVESDFGKGSTFYFTIKK
jgi:light-regulated signal transduction histidine kinase (bacteriophytochrome)